ncbi:MAG: multidrug transporter, partial [Hymenobacter sp.]|nr:multidrug transporter [Hymenobacter sp.]
MYTAQKFSLPEFVSWTRRDIYRALFWAAVPTVLYHFLGFTFLAISWVPIASLGTAVSLLVGFKNNVSYNRLWEARQAYGGIITTSRAFAAMARDFLAPTDPAVVPALFARHYAWLTALRYQLREPRAWENMDSAANREYAQRYRIPENETPLAQELARYLPAEQLAYLLTKQNLATQLLAEQSRHVNMLSEELTELQMSQLQAVILLLGQYQGRTEGLKNFPYPPNFASITTILLYIFVLLVPFGLLNEFDKLGAN